MPFLGALLLFFAVKETIVKDFFRELYRNLTVDVLSADNDSMLRFEALTDLWAKINVRLANFIFANPGRARLDLKKQAEEISKKCFFWWRWWQQTKRGNREKPYFDEPYFSDVVIDQQRDSEIKKIQMIGKQFPTSTQEGKAIMKLMKKHITSARLKLQSTLKNKIWMIKKKF